MHLLLRRRRTRRQVTEQPHEPSTWKSWIPLFTLAVLAWVLEILDGATAVMMMQNQGTELNPFIRGVFQGVGPLAVVLLKLGLATIVLSAFLYLARVRRRVLARNCLLLTVVLAAVGVASNIT
jgi:hypothetical protein